MTFGNRNFQRKPPGPNTGAMFPVKDKKTDKSPDFTGSIDIDENLLNGLIEAYKSTGLVKIRLIGYKNVSNEHGVWVKLMAKRDEPYDASKGRNVAQPQERSEKSEDRWS